MSEVEELDALLDRRQELPGYIDEAYVFSVYAKLTRELSEVNKKIRMLEYEKGIYYLREELE